MKGGMALQSVGLVVCTLNQSASTVRDQSDKATKLKLAFRIDVKRSLSIFGMNTDGACMKEF